MYYQAVIVRLYSKIFGDKVVKNVLTLFLLYVLHKNPDSEEIPKEAQGGHNLLINFRVTLM